MDKVTKTIQEEKQNFFYYKENFESGAYSRNVDSKTDDVFIFLGDGRDEMHVSDWYKE